MSLGKEPSPRARVSSSRSRETGSQDARPGEPASAVHGLGLALVSLGRRGRQGVSGRIDRAAGKSLGWASPSFHGDISSQVSCLARLHVVSFSIDENMITVEVMKRLGKLGTAFVREPRGTRTAVGTTYLPNHNLNV